MNARKTLFVVSIVALQVVIVLGAYYAGYYRGVRTILPTKQRLEAEYSELKTATRGAAQGLARKAREVITSDTVAHISHSAEMVAARLDEKTSGLLSAKRQDNETSRFERTKRFFKRGSEETSASE